MGTIPTTGDHRKGKCENLPALCLMHRRFITNMCSPHLFFSKNSRKGSQASTVTKRVWIAFKDVFRNTSGVDKAGRVVRGNCITTKQILCLWRESAGSPYSDFFGGLLLLIFLINVCYVAQANLGFMILLFHPPECWNYVVLPLGLTFRVLLKVCVCVLFFNEGQKISTKLQWKKYY